MHDAGSMRGTYKLMLKEICIGLRNLYKCEETDMNPCVPIVQF
jgi:hypothetical protein